MVSRTKPRYSPNRFVRFQRSLRRATGCSKLCLALGSIGLGLSAAAAATTYGLLHEQVEEVAAAVVTQHAQATCSAINRLMAGMALATVDSVVGRHAWDRAEADHADMGHGFGVFNLSRGGLDDLHLRGMDQAAVLSLLRRLPLVDPPQSPSQPAGAIGPASGRHACAAYTHSLHPANVRIYSLDRPASPGAVPGHGQVRGSYALLYGPWQLGGDRRLTFGLVALRRLMQLERGGPSRLSSNLLLGKGDGFLTSHLELLPPQGSDPMLRTWLQQAEAHDENHAGLTALRVIPFANRLLVAHFAVDHHLLARSCRRVAAAVFLMGLLGTAVVVLISRNSQLKLRRFNQALAEESRTDGLTKVSNRRAWDEALAAAESHRQRYGDVYGLIVVDLNEFKQINDLRGHHYGDLILQKTAGALTAALRSSDLLARVGGDEFAVLITAAAVDELELVIERLQAALREAEIRASIGGAISNGSHTLEQTWQQADDNMYLRKRGCVPSSP
ncbi:MAG: GGDEF domain-containing protein [Synechococcaceae cyanobacterium]|nr:GGDEF domain-containing protein [Synechococcaceae cyanobacterium]